MSTDLKYPVAYLEIQDFDADGNLMLSHFEGMPVMVMIQAGWCGACTQAKPEFQRYANMNIAGAATIQNDGERESERQLAAIVSRIYPEKMIGFPSYMLITGDGKRIAYNGPRDAESIKNFVVSHVR